MINWPLVLGTLAGNLVCYPLILHKTLGYGLAVGVIAASLIILVNCLGFARPDK
jgi:hypothetical protein